MKCYKNTHQVSFPGFIVGFIALMCLAGMLTGCSSNYSDGDCADSPVATVESVAPATTDAAGTVQAPIEDITDTTEAIETETAEEEHEEYEIPMASPTAHKNDGLATVKITDDTIIETSTETVYNFRTEGSAGCGLDGTVRSYELYYGIHASVKGSGLTYRAYSYDKDITPVKALFMRDSSKNYFNLEVGTSDKTIDLGNQSNDAFTLFVMFSNDTTCFMTIYINDGKPYIVDSIYEDAEYVRECILSKQDTLSALTEKYGITPENSLGVTHKDFCYPVYPWNSNYRCDTDLWRELAHEIVTDDTLPDSLKTTMLHDWMTANLSYDYYLVREYGSFTGRQTINEDRSGTWSMYNTHAGICRDFVNVYAIMCRELDIPCSCLGNGKHTWNIIWIDGKWCDIDLTTDIQRAVYKEDVSDVTNADDTICYTAFLTDWFVQSIGSDTNAGQSFYTEKFATTGKH